MPLTLKTLRDLLEEYDEKKGKFRHILDHTDIRKLRKVFNGNPFIRAEKQATGKLFNDLEQYPLQPHEIYELCLIVLDRDISYSLSAEIITRLTLADEIFSFFSNLKKQFDFIPNFETFHNVLKHRKNLKNLIELMADDGPLHADRNILNNSNMENLLNSAQYVELIYQGYYWRSWCNISTIDFVKNKDDKAEMWKFIIKNARYAEHLFKGIHSLHRIQSAWSFPLSFIRQAFDTIAPMIVQYENDLMDFIKNYGLLYEGSLCDKANITLLKKYYPYFNYKVVEALLRSKTLHLDNDPKFRAFLENDPTKAVALIKIIEVLQIKNLWDDAIKTFWFNFPKKFPKYDLVEVAEVMEYVKPFLNAELLRTISTQIQNCHSWSEAFIEYSNLVITLGRVYLLNVNLVSAFDQADVEYVLGHPEDCAYYLAAKIRAWVFHEEGILTEELLSDICKGDIKSTADILWLVDTLCQRLPKVLGTENLAIILKQRQLAQQVARGAFILYSDCKGHTLFNETTFNFILSHAAHAHACAIIIARLDEYKILTPENYARLEGCLQNVEVIAKALAIRVDSENVEKAQAMFEEICAKSEYALLIVAKLRTEKVRVSEHPIASSFVALRRLARIAGQANRAKSLFFSDLPSEFAVKILSMCVDISALDEGSLDAIWMESLSKPKLPKPQLKL